MPGVDRRPVGRHVGRVDDVLDRERYAVQRTARPLRVARTCLREYVPRIDVRRGLDGSSRASTRARQSSASFTADNFPDAISAAASAAEYDSSPSCVPPSSHWIPRVDDHLIVATDRHPRQPLEYLDDRRAVFLVESGGAAHVVDLLRKIGQEQRHAEPRGEARFEVLVLVGNVDRPARREVTGEEPGYPVLELHAVTGARAHDFVDLARVEPGLLAEHHRLRDGDGLVVQACC